MKRRIMLATLCLVMLVSTVLTPFTAYASSTAKILKVNTGAYLRDPSDYSNVIGTIKKGTKVLWMGKTKNSFYLIQTTEGKKGYIFKDYLSAYGAVKKKQVYVTKSSSKIYKSMSTSSGTVAKVGSGRVVLVYETKNGWAFVRTTSGKGGYMKTSVLKRY